MQRHQQFGILERFLGPEPLRRGGPSGVDAEIDDQLGDIDVLRARARVRSPAPPREDRSSRWRTHA